MRSAAEPSGDPGLASERTALAWQRMALSFTSIAAVTLAAAAHRQVPWLLAPVGGAASSSRRRSGATRAGGSAIRGLTTARRPIALLAYATAAAAVAAAALSLVRPG